MSVERLTLPGVPIPAGEPIRAFKKGWSVAGLAEWYEITVAEVETLIRLGLKC